MASVVFFRAVNVGGHQSFQPSALAKELAEYKVVSIGAAGTLVVREDVEPEKLREEILRRLPFEPEMMICPAKNVLALVRGHWFDEASVEAGTARFVSVLQKAPDVKPPLPFEYPPGPKWEVWLLALTDRFVLSVRRIGKTYSNAVVEKHLRIPATTRTWNTLQSIRKVLEKPSPERPL